ncbi:hypothetical protein EYF80_013449 [Liparis tanakae]|uniref:Uncharacterized protein n=1 Tax=Liparis tanakae TaxID=230148 RepID=A0A4Z2IER2_9TELE|nr:hypothetical protein EYF80_013449 [Liparis tanakae]
MKAGGGRGEYPQEAEEEEEVEEKEITLRHDVVFRGLLQGTAAWCVTGELGFPILMCSLLHTDGMSLGAGSGHSLSLGTRRKEEGIYVSGDAISGV